MKKKVMLITGLLAIALVGFSQAVKDRQVIPVAVNLNQVLRMTITNGGNIEFVFNSIDDYRLGLSGDAATSGSANPASSDPFYVTNFTVASSTRWDLNYGAEEATFIGTDDPTNNQLDLANVGYTLTSTGTHNFEAAANPQGTDLTAELWSAPTINGTEVAGLENYPVLLIDDNTLAAGGEANAGDDNDNAFEIVWRCGTGPIEAGAAPVAMIGTSLLDQDPSPAPDRYVANVIFELGIK
jgi:hypothetical protein